MITHNQLADAFGEENIVLLDDQKARTAHLSTKDLHLLTQVGLPRYAGPLFTTEVSQDGPGLFDIEEFEANGILNRVIFLGGPESDPYARFFLDTREGFVVLMMMTSAGSEAELVNTTLDAFVEFIYHIGRRYQSPEPETLAEVRQETDALESRLRERDAHAFREPEAWWHMAIDAIRQQGEMKHS
ncbi:SUKH-4 family immunity protein [Streptomyces acidicola]|uniref:SUKH-4 family immunity protein n=1 Tax=Streptomyces acidicola TaxID=2596892 RepID=UPI00381457F8